MTLTRLMASAALIALLAQPALAQNQGTAGQGQTQGQEQAQAGGQGQGQAGGQGQSQAGESEPEDELGASEIEFATKAAEGGLKEVRLGELAQQQAENEEVRQFGQRMVEDHGKANEELMRIAQESGLQLPTELPEDAQQLYDELQQKSGAEFDQAYMAEMVSDHEKDVEEFEQYVQTGTHPDLVTFAQSTLPTLEEHLQMAQEIHKQVSAAAGEQQPTTEQAASEAQPQTVQRQEPAATAGAAGGIAREATEQQQAAERQQMVSVEEALGSTVVNSQGDEVGEIEDIVADQNQTRYAIVSVGGFLGIGDKSVAVPLDQLQLGEDQTYLMSAETEEQLEQLPEYEEGQYQSLREQQSGQLRQ